MERSGFGLEECLFGAPPTAGRERGPTAARPRKRARHTALEDGALYHDAVRAAVELSIGHGVIPLAAAALAGATLPLLLGEGLCGGLGGRLLVAAPHELRADRDDDHGHIE